MNTIPRVLFIAPIILIVAAAAEGMYLQHVRRQSYDWRAYFASLGDALGRVFINRVIGLGIAGSVFGLVARFRIATIPMNRWWSWLGLLLALEFFYYWMHRADHRVQWLWATHAVHHSTNAYNLSAAYRLGWTSGISGGFLFFAPLVWMGFPVQAVLAVAALNLLYQFWLHTELVPPLGPLEWIFNTPRASPRASRAQSRIHRQEFRRRADRIRSAVRNIREPARRSSVRLRACAPCPELQPVAHCHAHLVRNGEAIATCERIARSGQSVVRTAAIDSGWSIQTARHAQPRFDFAHGHTRGLDLALLVESTDRSSCLRSSSTARRPCAAIRHYCWLTRSMSVHVVTSLP